MSTDADQDLPAAVALAHQLAALAETDPDHPLLIAVRFALEISDARRARRRAVRMAGLDVHGGQRWHWADYARNHVPHAEIARRRAELGPLAGERRQSRST